MTSKLELKIDVGALKVEIEYILRMMSACENKSIQKAALELIPIHTLRKKTYEKMGIYMEYKLLSPVLYSLYREKLFLVQLMSWFKREFFRWFTPPDCPECRTITSHFNTVYPVDDPSIAAIEIYKCIKCQWSFSFSRHTNVHKLLATRVGRCSEWTQVFCLMCRSLGLRTRYVLDLNDHVWAEVYSELEKRWIHCDPPEGVFDNPLMYEMNWGRQMTIVIGVNNEEVQDVTWRYSSCHSLVQSRRSKEFDADLLDYILSVRKNLQSDLPVAYRNYLRVSLIKELVELMTQPQPEEQKPDLKIQIPGFESNIFYYLKPFTSFTWTPFLSEILNKEINILYCCSQDYYCRNGIMKDIYRIGWQSCVYNFKNVFRKIEKDWNMVYLARKEGTSVGSVTWHVSTEGTELAIKEVEISCEIFTKLTGLIKWELSNRDMCISLFNRMSYKTSLLTGSQKLFITAYLLGGEGDVGWQYAQINRQPLNDKQHTLCIKITLTNC